MRKIMILFVASIVIVLSGCFVFAAEVSSAVFNLCDLLEMEKIASPGSINI